MDILIRSIQLTATGREIVREREASGDEVSVGRASENTIALPDLAVEQKHLVITEAPNGTLHAKAVGTLGFTHDGVHAMEAAIDPARGGELGLGTYRLEIGKADDGRTLVTIRQADKDEGAAKDRLDGFALGGALPSKRAMAWIGLATILVVFLAVPIFTHLTRDVVAEPDIDDEGVVVMDASWSTGALSLAHHGLEDNCEACHVEPFVAVRDETCLTCHGGLGDHADPERQVASLPEFTGGEALLWDVAHTFGKPGPGACSDCHTEHEGETRMEPPRQQFCADCHETMDERLTDTALGNAADFGTAHPQFQSLVTPERGAPEIRLAVDNITSDFNGVKFPHDMHLSDTNGVARMAQRLGINAGGAPLECDDCHQTTADGVRFLPVEMEDSCEECHSLVYDRVGTTFRSLSHGDIEAAQADLAAQDRSPRQPVSTGRRRPGPFGPGGLYYGNFGRVLPLAINRASFADDGLCGECHYPALDGSLAVEPVVQRSRFFQHGWFDHDAHGPNAMGTRDPQEACATCHAAETSESSSDFLIPDLESCRDCHLGEEAQEAEVPSSCAMCHSYHPPEGVDSAPRRVASLLE